VNVGDAEVASLKVPEPGVADQPYDSGDGPPSASCAVEVSEIRLPTKASPGLAEIPSMSGQMLIVPLT